MHILDTSSDTIELRHGQIQNLNSQVNNFLAREVTHQSVNEQFKLATEPIPLLDKSKDWALDCQIGLS